MEKSPSFPLCQLKEVEQELHFILSCLLYNNLRSKLFADINKRYPNFNDLDNNIKITFLFNDVGPFICRLKAAYVHLCMDLRQSFVIWCNIWISAHIYFITTVITFLSDTMYLYRTTEINCWCCVKWERG